MTDDPFKNVEETGATAVAVKEAPAKTAKKKAEPADEVDPMATFLADMNAMTIDEEDFAPPEEFVSGYIKPADKTWIPVRIVGVKLEQRDGTKAVVAYTPNGEMVTNPTAIDKLVAEYGAEQVVETITNYQFVVEAEHESTLFGDRSSPYRLYTPVFPIRIPFQKPRKRGNVEEVGFDKISGKRLLAATRVVKRGMKVEENEEVLQQLADAMHADGGAVVMARVRHRTKKSDDPVPRVYDSGPMAGQFVKARMSEDGSFVRLGKQGDKFFNKAGGEEYDGDTSSLIQVGDDYLIPDDSQDAGIVKDMKHRETVFDNLGDDVYPLPGRSVTIQRATDGDEEVEVQGEITWETLGFIAVSPIKAGTAVQAVIETDGEKETITATWLGDHWQETQQPYELTVSDLGEPRLLPVVGNASPNALDTFKG